MKKYIVLRGVSLEDLAEVVNRHIDQGYIPTGSVTLVAGELGYFLQPMVQRMVVA